MPMAVARGVWTLAFVVLLAVLASPIGFAAELPPLTGRVVDNAGMIDAATEAAIVAKLEAYEKKTSIQIVVATIPSLGGEAIEPYANRLFRAWKLGQAGDDNGVLLLVAKDDRKMRIEVGYGLEGTLTDLHSKLIIENRMVPAFRAGDFAGGISGAVDDIITVLDGNAEELTKPRPDQNGQEFPIESIFVALWITFFVGAFAMTILVPIFGKKIGRNRYRWLGMDFTIGGGSSGGSSSGGGWSSGGGSWSSGGGGFSGGGGSSGGGGASGGW
ncbi:MAG: YgcG family protein [Rhizobiales bacterium]|nr:YgcG family protein [Hyphomicrobiales bacterium]